MLGAALVVWNLLLVPVAEMIVPSERGREGDHASGFVALVLFKSQINHTQHHLSKSLM